MATNRGGHSGDIDNQSSHPPPYNLRSGSARSIVAAQQPQQTAPSADRSLLSNDETLNLVKQLKSTVKERLQKGSAVDETFIEEQVADIRVQSYPNELNPEQWKAQLPSQLKTCSKDVLRQTMAYGNEPKQLLTILEDKMNRESSMQARPDTSLANLKHPLKTLRSLLKEQRPPNLLDAILQINDKEVTRADRMLYSEAQRLMPSLSDYTFEHAHDQVQAIRLAHYRSDDERDLRDLIDLHRTFEQAYSYLQDLTRKQMDNNGRRAAPIRVPDLNHDSPRATSAGQRTALSNESHQPAPRSSLSHDGRPPSATPAVPPRTSSHNSYNYPSPRYNQP